MNTLVTAVYTNTLVEDTQFKLHGLLFTKHLHNSCLHSRICRSTTANNGTSSWCNDGIRCL